MYVELHAQSAFSFLEGAELPETLVAEAARLGMPALALVDRDGLHGAPRFHRAAVAAGLRPLLGSEVTLDDGSRLPLLVEDREGYQNLSRLITRMKLGAPKGRARLALEDLAPHTAGLVCLTGGACGPLAAAVRAGDRARARRRLDTLVGLFGRSGCFVEVQRHLDRAQERDLQRLVALARDARLPIVATAQPLYGRPGGRAVADVFTCIREKTDLDRAGRRLAANAERGLADAATMAVRFHDLPEALAVTGELALRLGFTLKDLGYRFPDFPRPPGVSADAHLRELTLRGVRTRYGTGALAARARRQVEHELAVIARLGLAGYFLIVWDLVEFCRTQDILVQGRGSAANSAVCYALGLTAVDPVGMELLFERFLSEARGEWPDIDLDLPSGERREAVIQYVYRRYGRLGAGMTANVVTYRGRSAAREVGKALGLPGDLQDRLAALVSTWGYQDPADRLTLHLREAGCDPAHPRIRAFAALWARLQDLPRHLGQHSGGMVIAAARLDDVVPLEPATMPGRVVVQWDKDDCAALGIVKVDLLGLRMMSVLQEAITMAAERGRIVDLAHLPPDDPDVYRMLQRADTIGVFQVESRAQMATLPRIHPERFYDLVVQVAIIRPGPIVGDMVHPYIRRRRGREPVQYPHPSLEPILARTLGVPLFQEQLLRMAMTTAGFSGAEAEELRRAFGFKRSERRMAEVETKLRAGMARRGIEGAAAESIVHAITAFALYGFPECVVDGTLVIDADTGRRVPIEDIAGGRVTVCRTLACDVRFRIRPRRVLAATASGRRLVYRLRTALGREVMATAEHPLLTLQGWRAMAALRPGDYVAAARSLPTLGRRRWPRYQLVVLADLIAEGNLCHPTTAYFYTKDLRHLDEYVTAVQQFDNTRATVARHRSCYSVHVRRNDSSRPIGMVQWAKQLGMWGCGARAKQVPRDVFELGRSDLAVLLARLWDGDGCITGQGHCSYDTVSPQLAQDIQHLLLRLGIVSRIYARRHRSRGRLAESFVVTIAGQSNLRRFSRWVGQHFLDPDKRQCIQAKTAVDVQGRSRLARHFDSPDLARLADSDLYWDRILSVEPVGIRETYDLHIDADHNFLANDLVVHNSHASSFALLAYASAWLKVHEPAAFYAALLNNQPMGFYHAATVVKDAQRHGQRMLPVSVRDSEWSCTVEGNAVRLGLRCVKGLRESAARALVAARAARAFTSVQDLAARTGLDRAELATLAAIGALGPLGGTRRASLWAAAQPHPGPLFTDIGDTPVVAEAQPRRTSTSPPTDQAGLASPAPTAPRRTSTSPPTDQAGLASPAPTDVSPLREMTDAERLAADYAGTGVTLGHHPMALRRDDLTRRRVVRAADLPRVPGGSRVRVAGSVIVRQRPGTAKGFVFLSLEDETGIANVIVTPDLFARRRLPLVTAPFLLVEGILQIQDSVLSIRAARVEPLPSLGHAVPSHDFG